MRNSPVYLLILFLGICGVAGYSYYESDIVTVKIISKEIADGRSKRGITSSIYRVNTDQGEYSISKFPLLGFTFSAEEVHNSLEVGQTVTMRIGSIPPSLGGEKQHTQIFDVLTLEN